MTKTWQSKTEKIISDKDNRIQLQRPNEEIKKRKERNINGEDKLTSEKGKIRNDRNQIKWMTENITTEDDNSDKIKRMRQNKERTRERDEESDWGGLSKRGKDRIQRTTDKIKDVKEGSRENVWHEMKNIKDKIRKLK